MRSALPCSRLTLSLLLLASLTVLAGCAGSTAAPERPPAPEGLTAQTLEGNNVSLSGMQGQVVVLDFFSQYCEPCVDGLPEQAALQERFAGNRVTVMLVAQDEDKEVLAEFLTSTPAGSLPVALDPEQTWFDAFGLEFVPGLVVLDREGRMAGRYLEVDSNTHAELTALVEKLAKE